MTDEIKTRVPAPEGAIPDLATPVKTGQLTVSQPGPVSPPASPAPKRRTSWIWAGLIVVAMVAAALWYFQPWVSKGVTVAVETVELTPLIRVLAVNGRVAPLHLVVVKPTIAGEVLTVLAVEGDRVMQGAVLARIDASAQQAIVRQAMAGLDAGLVGQAQADASLLRAEALGDNIARLTLQDARSAQQTAVQDVARLTALLDQAQIALGKYTILAPTAGTVLTRDAETGQTVDATTALFSMADLGQLVVETDVDETYATQITPGLAAVLQLMGETDKLDGHVSFVAAQVDAATGGLAVKIAFDAPLNAPVGLTATANIIVDQQHAAISVPRAALVTDATGTAVFVAIAGQSMRRVVTVVDWPADRLQVTQGLAPGDVVIVDATGLSDGAAITLSAAAIAGP